MKRLPLFRNTVYSQPLLLLVQRDVWAALQQVCSNHNLASLGTQLDYWLSLAIDGRQGDDDEWLEVFHEQLQRLTEALGSLLQQRKAVARWRGKIKVYNWLTPEEVQHPEQAIAEFCRIYSAAHATALCWYWLDVLTVSASLTPAALQSLLPAFEVIMALISAAYSVV